MYLVSVYFDDTTNKKLDRLINRIAEKTGNTFMTDNHVPPHMTISSIEARNAEVLIPYVKGTGGKLNSGTIKFVSAGMFFPYVMYVTPVLNMYLQDMIKVIYEAVADIDEVTVSKLYRPMQILPHVTLGKKLTKEQMKIAFDVVQDGFVPFEGRVISIGLAKANPHEDVLMIEL